MLPDNILIPLRQRGAPLAMLAILGWMAGSILTLDTGDARSSLRPRDGGDARLIAFQPLPEIDGQMCQLLPASAGPRALAAWQQAQSGEEQSTAGGARPTEAAKAEAAKRLPIRTLRDPNAAFSAVAVDHLHDEVILTDENNFGIMTYSRTENTPATAKMSEPRRLIQGKSTSLEYNCSVYVDPATGDIYGVNNDTIDTLVIFNREARGNVPPTRKLYTPHTTYGITVDEQAQEMFLTIQDDHAVVVYSKSAKEEEGPLRILQGSLTGLADPHGIAIDEEAGVLYVANWGTTNERPAPGTVPGGGSFGRGNTRTDWPIGRAKAFPASGKLLPASITVYAKNAKGDASPLRVIRGPKTQLNWPTAVAVDPVNKELYVANDTGDSVTVYSADANGDAAPIRTIQGPKSLVKNPTGLYYDKKHEELWVTNFGNHTAAVFKRTAAGDTPPLRVIRSAPLDAPAPMMGNPHTIAYDTKRDEILVSN